MVKFKLLFVDIQRKDKIKKLSCKNATQLCKNRNALSELNSPPICARSVFGIGFFSWVFKNTQCTNPVFSLPHARLISAQLYEALHA